MKNSLNAAALRVIQGAVVTALTAAMTLGPAPTATASTTLGEGMASVRELHAAKVGSRQSKAVYLQVWSGREMGHCSGALVRNRVILTAGHCLVWEDGSRATRVTAYFGHHWSRGKQKYLVKCATHRAAAGYQNGGRYLNREDWGILRTARCTTPAGKVLKRAPGKVLGTFGMKPYDTRDTAKKARLYYGYPEVIRKGSYEYGRLKFAIGETEDECDALGALLAQDKCGLHTRFVDYRVGPGGSGGPLLQYDDNARLEVVGIYSSGWAGDSFFFRLTDEIVSAVSKAQRNVWVGQESWRLRTKRQRLHVGFTPGSGSVNIDLRGYQRAS